MGAHSNIIKAYYPKIDSSDIDWVVSLFADDAVYERADAKYVNKEEIKDFFAKERKIRGRHVIEDLWPDEEARRVVAIGRFEGVGAEGDPRSVGFADVWEFNDQQKVTRRRTFLALGNNYVRR